jgi:hypothetical protein
MSRNPFTHAYLMRELWFYGLPGEEDAGPVAVRRVRLGGEILDDYLNVNIRQETPEVPVLSIDGRLSMSLTPMIVQALAVPIDRAHGRVGTAGLGLGYYALRVAAKSAVRAVDVYESDPYLIEWFRHAFAARPELRKIMLVEGDARETVAGTAYDVFFADIHSTLLVDAVVDDARRFRAANSFGSYSFCGAERVVLDAYLAGETADLDAHERRFFRHWRETPSADPAIALPRLYRPITDAPFRRRVFDALGRPWEPSVAT